MSPLNKLITLWVTDFEKPIFLPLFQNPFLKLSFFVFLLSVLTEFVTTEFSLNRSPLGPILVLGQEEFV